MFELNHTDLMSLEQTEKTKHFVRSVETLLDSGIVKKKEEVADKLKISPIVLSHVLNGRRNVANDVYRRFTEIYELHGELRKEDLKDQQIKLLTQQNEFMTQQNEYLKDQLLSNLKSIHESIYVNQAHLHGLSEAILNHRVAMEQKPAKAVRAEFDKTVASGFLQIAKKDK